MAIDMVTVDGIIRGDGWDPISAAPVRTYKGERSEYELAVGNLGDGDCSIGLYDVSSRKRALAQAERLSGIRDAELGERVSRFLSEMHRRYIDSWI